MRFVLLVCSIVVLAGCGGAASGGTTGSSASCAAPTLTVSPDAGAPGSPVRLAGDYFVDGSNNTRANGGAGEPPHPLTDLSVLLRQGDRTWTLAEHVDAAGDLGSFQATAALPDDVATGPAQVLVPDYGAPVVVTVR